MAYQAPAFMVAHNASKATIAGFATIASDTFSDDSKRAVIDSRQSELGSFTATGANAGFSIDMQTGVGSGTVNRVVIPAGHTFDGFDVVVKGENTGPTFPSPERAVTISVVGSGVLDFAFAVTNLRWWGLTVTGSGTEVFSLAEYWMGERKALNINDARVGTGFERSYEHNIAEAKFAGRTAVLELAPTRRKFSLLTRDLDPSAADFATLDRVIRDGRASPFWYWTPDSTDTGPYLVKLIRSATREQRSSVPMKTIRYQVELEMLEEL